MAVHQWAIVHPDAKIGKDVTIEAFCNVEADVEIGDGTVVKSGAYIMNGARIGKDCLIYPGAVIAGIPQDLKFKGEYSQAIIGDRTTVRECATISRGTAAKEKTIVGSDCLLMAYTHVAHDCIVGNHCIMVNQASIAGEVEVGDWAILAGGTMVHQFVRIGEHAMLRGGSLVAKDVPPYILAGREPLSYCGVNSVGLRRRGFTNEKINEIQSIYRVLFNGGMNYSEAIRTIEANLPQSKERDYITSFVKSSPRGIIKGLMD